MAGRLGMQLVAKSEYLSAEEMASSMADKSDINLVAVME